MSCEQQLAGAHLPGKESCLVRSIGVSSVSSMRFDQQLQREKQKTCYYVRRSGAGRTH